MSMGALAAGEEDNPRVVSTTPLTGTEIATKPSQTFSIKFDKSVQLTEPGDSKQRYIKLNSSSSANPVKEVTLDDANFVPSSNSTTYKWTESDLKAGDYYITIGSNTFVDTSDSNKLYPGTTSNEDWKFKINPQQIEAPVVKVDGTTTTTANLSLQYNTTPVIQPGDVGEIEVYSGSTEYKAAVVNITGSNNKFNVAISGLNPNTAYSIKSKGYTNKLGDKYAGFSSNVFTTSKVVSEPVLISGTNRLIPNSGSSNVHWGTTSIKAIFDQPIQIYNVNGISLYRDNTLVGGQSTSYVSVSGNTLIIKPFNNTLDQNANYRVVIQENAIRGTGNNNLFYRGLGYQGGESWTFSTATNDKTPPVLQDATMYTNNTIRLRYNEALYSVGNLSKSAFTVSVNGENRRISNAYVSGEYVYLTLDLGVAVGQVIRVSYSANSTWGRIQDLAANPATGFSNREVTNGVDSVLPKPKDGYVNGNTLYLTFSESLKGLSSSYAYEQFTVTANGSNKSIKSISSYSGSSSVTLTLDSSVGNGEVIKVSYQPGSYPLQDFRGNNIAPFTDFFVRNYKDTIAPEFTGVSGSGNKIILTYNEPLRTSPLPLKSQFSVLVNNAAVYVNAVEIASNQVILTLASSFTQEQAVTLSYVSGYGGTADLNGNLAGFINLQPVTYSNIAQGIQSATVNGDTITITYNSTLRAVSFLPPNQFSVLVNNAQVGVQSASISGNRVTLKLSSQVAANQSVTLSYMTGSTPLYSVSGEKLNTFSGMTVQHISNTGNNNTGANGQPSYVSVMSRSTFNKIGYVLNVSTAKTTSSKSYRGVSTNRYTIDTMQMQNAFKFLTTLAANRMLVFEVPPSERAAEVAIPLSALSTVIGGTQTYSIAVKYKESLYEIPLEGISLSEITRALNVSSLNSVYLIIQLETVQRSQLNMPTVINGVSVSTLMEPVEIRVVAVNGNGSTNSGISVGHAGNYYVRMSGSRVTTTQTTLVNYNLTLNIMERMLASVAGGNGNLLFVAKVNGNSIIGPVMGSVFYPDINKHWGKGDINELTSKLVVSPRSASSPVFEPNRNITRGEFGEYIAKALGLTSKMSARSFPDVPANTRGGYIASAVDAGIITGYPDGTFKPEQPITREQMALMMVRAMSYAKQNVTLNGTAAQTLSRFKDAGKIRDKNTVAKAVQSGIMQGMSATSFQPRGNATRAQAVTMIKRVLSKLNYL